MRWEIGPNYGHVTRKRAVPPPPPPAKADIAVAAKSYDAATETVTVEVPAYDLATHNELAKVRVYAVPAGTSLPATGDDWVKSSHPFTEFESVGHVEGFAVGIELPAIPADVPADVVDFFAQIILGFTS